MLCPRCTAQIKDGNNFCIQCGLSINADTAPGFDPGPSPDPRSVKEKPFNLPLIISIFALLLIALSAMLISMFRSPVSKFIDAVDNAQYSDAAVIYMKHISADPEKAEKVSIFLSEEAAEIKKAFEEEKLRYEDAKKRLNGLISIGAKTAKLKDVYGQITRLNDSRLAFEDGNAYSRKNDYFNAIKAYKKVIKEDSNYAVSLEYISLYKAKYKEQVLKASEYKADNEDYYGALQLLTDASEVLSNDPDISEKMIIYQKADEEKQAINLQNHIDNARDNQKVVVLSADVAIQSYNDKVLYPDMLQAIVKNNSNKTVTTMYVSFLAFDENGSPVEIRPDSSEIDPRTEIIGNAPGISIAPSDTFGDDVGWSLAPSHGIDTVLACVKLAYFDDGSAWSNPYYDYWIAEYKDKPLH